MSYSLNSFEGESYKGLYTGLAQGLLRGILGVSTIAHMQVGGDILSSDFVYMPASRPDFDTGYQPLPALYPG